MVEHNHWPALWAQCNYDAVKESGKLGEVVYFMRAGYTGSQKYCTLLWAGDQSVDFSLHDGLASVICGALSAGMSGCGLSHSDIGGYTSLFGNCRTKELFLRWSEMAAFTPVMRTHECNRPDENFQYYDDEDCMNKLARLVDVYTMLAPYTKALVAENAALNGLSEVVTPLAANVFDLLPELEKRPGPAPYDFIILDPPAFTKSRKTVESAMRGYKELNYRAMKLLPRGGYLATCSCSHFATPELFEGMLRSAARDAGVQLRQIEARQQSPDHPILWNVPETSYLKFYLFQVV